MPDPADKRSSTKSTSFSFVLDRYISRRALLSSTFATGAAATLSCLANSKSDSVKAKVVSKNGLLFTELEHGLDAQLAVAPGYEVQVLLRWGDALVPGLTEFDPLLQSAKEQALRFGYNNDYVGYIPLDAVSPQLERGVMAVNHENVTPELMFKGGPRAHDLNKEQVDVCIAACGLSVFEVLRDKKGWMLKLDSKLNRRITPWSRFEFTGPAAGHPRLKSELSADGIATLGTYGNCAGGVTPWGTILSGEENVDDYFLGDRSKLAEKENYTRFSHRENKGYGWGKYYSRWDLEKDPQGMLHAGWVIEIDPLDPNATPKKHTALGRFKHEGCNLYVNKDGRVVAYSGDDGNFEYIYRFISRNKFDPNNRESNKKLLSEGELSVAKFNEQGELYWLALVYGQGLLTEKNGFHCQADVCFDTRKAADLLEATPMDRPEDVDINPKNGRVYAMLTKNYRRKRTQRNPMNPRASNSGGHIIEFWPKDGDHAQPTFAWDVFLLAGDPKKGGTLYHPNISENGWFACPDNCTFDQRGNLWITTDSDRSHGIADGVWACEVDGTNRALTKCFLRAPVGAEVCGPQFTPDSTSFFAAIQHPAHRSNFDSPLTRWPDFNSKLPPRPALIVVNKKTGGMIGA